ncbi:hypothetical protein C8F01DRAFT_1105941 [Mycena amicta]|nr:hypothetical protein C8F01DRAFT_1105941 [Mycena amicta]
MAPSWWIDDGNTRGTYSLVSSCIFTLGLCVWTAIHLNIPEPGSAARHFLRKITWLAVGLMAPEVVTFIAWNQYSSALRLVNELSSSEWKKQTSSKWKAFGKLVGLEGQYGSVPVTEDTDAEVEPPPFGADWKLIHGFYVVMGGYTVDFGKSANRFLPAEVKRLTLTPDGLLFIAERAPELLPRISEEDIEDKSKADGLAKLLVALQAAWFCLQCISRGAQHLPISLLEITTGAHALYTLFTYLLWAKKPMDISVPTTVVGANDPGNAKLRQLCAYMFMCSPISGKLLARKHPRPTAKFMEQRAECQWIRNTSQAASPLRWDGKAVVLDVNGPTLPGTRLQYIGKNMPFSYQTGQRKLDFTKRALPATRLRLQPEDVVRWRLVSAALSDEPSLHFAEKEYFVLRSSNVPTYGSWQHATKRMILGFTAAEVFYGLIHAAGWNSAFASDGLRLVWRFASCFISGGGLFLGGAFAWAAGESTWYGETFSAVVVFGTFEFVIRMFLLVEALLNVSVLPPGVYVLPGWSSFIPHWA